MTDGLDCLLDLRRRLYRMLDARDVPVTPPAVGFTPPLDIISGPEGLTITLELPGVPREAVQVELEGHLLTISGRREVGAEAPSPARRERPCGSFSRSLALPTSDDHDLSAALRDGVLTVQVRRQAPTPVQIGEAPQ